MFSAAFSIYFIHFLNFPFGCAISSDYCFTTLYNVQEAADMNLVILPFKPMAMKVLQCSFLSGMK